MDNIVNLGAERPRPRRRAGMPGDGARILFFTGVRYCRRSDDNTLSGSGGDQADHSGVGSSNSELSLDRAAH